MYVLNKCVFRSYLRLIRYQNNDDNTCWLLFVGKREMEDWSSSRPSTNQWACACKPFNEKWKSIEIDFVGILASIEGSCTSVYNFTNEMLCFGGVSPTAQLIPSRNLIISAYHCFGLNDDIFIIHISKYHHSSSKVSWAQVGLEFYVIFVNLTRYHLRFVSRCS